MLAARRRESALVATRDILRAWKIIRVFAAIWRQYEEFIESEQLLFNCIAFKKYAYRIKIQEFWLISVRNKWNEATNLKWKKLKSVIFKWFF